MKILGIPGSLRKQSYNLGALKAAQQVAPAGVTIEIFDLNGIPVYNQDLDGTPPARVTGIQGCDPGCRRDSVLDRRIQLLDSGRPEERD